MLAGLPELLIAQKVVTGTVRSLVDWKPLDQVSVIIKGSSRGVVTDQNGHYSITMADSDKTLIFRYLGFHTQEVSIGGGSVVNIIMDRDDITSHQQDFQRNSFVQYGLLTGLNHTPYGFQIKSHIRRYRHVRWDISTQYQYLSGKGNSKSLFNISRANNWTVFGEWTNLELEIKKRQISTESFVQNLRELAMINSIRIKDHEIGLGLGIQTEMNSEIHREHFALITQWSRQVYFHGAYYTRIELKRWNNNTQIGWAIHRYLLRQHILIQLKGEHLKAYNEITIGLAHDLDFGQ